MTPHASHRQPSARRHAAAVTLALACLPMVACAACSAPKEPRASATLSDSDQRSADRDFVREPFKDQSRQGVVRQRALFDAHFVPDSDRLNGLGRRDVAVLAEAMRTTGGGISVRCGSVSPELFAARVATVRRTLIAAGIDPARVIVNSDLPKGPGTTTEDALMIRADIRAMPMAPISDAVIQPNSQNLQPGPNSP